MTDAIAIVAAPVPGLVIYLLGRRMLRWLGDPTFDDRLWRHRVRSGQIAIVSLVALGVLAWRWMPVTLPLFLLSVWLGAFPLRKRAFGEGWAIGEYLRHCVRVTLGVTSFWFAVLFLPLIAGTAGQNNCIWVLAAMFFWTYVCPAQHLWGLDVAPLTDSALLQRFEAIVAKSRARPPKILQFGSPKSHFVNALASPQPRQANVLFSRALLRHLDADETTAIFAHEVAHLESYTPKRMRVAGWALFFIIALGAIFPLITGSALTAQLLWLFGISVGGVLRRRRRQERETRCDLRAVELCGDAGALIRALTKSHELGRIPVRWDAKRARRATHPSLEQRVADITSHSSRTSPGSADIDPARSSAS